MSSLNIPGADAMQDSLEFIKKMWGGLGVPGMVVPTLSVEEINKKITDLKAVESWLNLNLNMLRTTIQALEVQSATISALQAMGAVGQAGGEHQGGASGEPAANAWTMASGFPFSFMSPAQDAPAATTQAAQPVAATETEAEAEAPPAASSAAESSLGNSSAWWDLLQNQFKQAVDSVVAAEKKAAPAKAAAQAKPAVKPRSRASSGATPKPAGKKNTVAGGKTAARASKARVVSK